MAGQAPRSSGPCACRTKIVVCQARHLSSANSSLARAAALVITVVHFCVLKDRRYARWSSQHNVIRYAATDQAGLEPLRMGDYRLPVGMREVPAGQSVCADAERGPWSCKYILATSFRQ